MNVIKLIKQLMLDAYLSVSDTVKEKNEETLQTR